MATVIDSVQHIIEEDLAPGVRDALIKLDSLFEDVIEDNVSATQDDIGRDWQVIHTFITSYAGALRALNSAEGDNIWYGQNAATGEVAVGYDTPSEFPGLDEFVSPGYMQKKVSLKSWMGNMFLPHQLMRADRLTAAIASAVEMTLKQTAKMIAHVRSNIFFATDSFNSFGTVAASGLAGGSTSDSHVEFTLSAGRVRRFQPGMLVDIWDSTGATQRNDSSPLIVERVDPLAKKIRCFNIKKLAAAYETFGSQVASGDIVVLRGSKGAGPTGIFDWIVNSGTVYNINLTYFPQFKSLVKANLASLLTDSQLRNLLGGYLDSFGDDAAPDVILATQGVMNGWLQEIEDLRQFSPVLTGRRGSEAGYTYVYEGKAYTFRASSQMPTGYLLAFKSKNNIKRYVPPALPGSGRERFFSGNIEFVAPLAGSKSIWLPALGTNARPTQYIQAPFVSVEEYLPEELRGLKVSGITESIDLGD